MPQFRVTVAYDGTGFVGWQRQASGVSIQGLLEEAAAQLEEGPVTVHGAGRTDAGVHALGQVASFALTRAVAPDVVVRALNVRLPESVRVLDAAEAPADFHPRFDARSKTYRYRIWNGDVVSPFEHRFVWHVPGALDVGAMDVAARLVEGTHDFAAFQTAGSDVKTTERTVTSSLILRPAQDERVPGSLVARQAQDARVPDSLVLSVSKDEPVISYEVSANGFLRHMVRAIVGTLVEIGRGRRPPQWIREVIASRDRSAAGRTVPAQGLCLVRVDY